MRWYLACVMLGALATEAPADEFGDSLSAKDLQTYFSPYLSEVRSCYVTHAHGKAVEGALRLELTVHPSGRITSFRFAAPGVVQPWLGRLDACLRRHVPSWHFPVRAGFTVAVMPFVFHRTTVPGAGPIESCRDPRGCATSASPQLRAGPSGRTPPGLVSGA
jgi:hypothetical protein